MVDTILNILGYVGLILAAFILLYNKDVFSFVFKNKLAFIIIFFYFNLFNFFLNYPLGIIFYCFGLFIIISFVYFIFLLYSLRFKLNLLSLLLSILLMISIIFYYFPLIMLIVLTLTGVFSLAFSFLYQDFFYLYKNKFNYLYSYRLIKFFISLDETIFSTNENEKQFDHFCYLLGFFSLNYIFLAKIYVLFTVQPHIYKIDLFNFNLLSLGIFLSLFAYILKFILNISRILSIGYQFSFIMNPEQPHFDSDESASLNKPSLSTNNFYSFFNRHTHSHFYSSVPRTSKFFTLNRTIGICTFGLSCVALHYTIKTYNQSLEQTRQAQEQTRQAQEQTYEARRMNDLSELDKGLITKEEYNKRYPRS